MFLRITARQATKRLADFHIIHSDTAWRASNRLQAGLNQLSMLKMG